MTLVISPSQPSCVNGNGSFTGICVPDTVRSVLQTSFLLTYVATLLGNWHQTQSVDEQTEAVRGLRDSPCHTIHNIQVESWATESPGPHGSFTPADALLVLHRVV